MSKLKEVTIKTKQELLSFCEKNDIFQEKNYNTIH